MFVTPIITNFLLFSSIFFSGDSWFSQIGDAYVKNINMDSFDPGQNFFKNVIKWYTITDILLSYEKAFLKKNFYKILLFVFLLFLTVLGSNFRWTWYWPYWNISWWFRFTIRKNQCLLQWSYRYLYSLLLFIRIFMIIAIRQFSFIILF